MQNIFDYILSKNSIDFDFNVNNDYNLDCIEDNKNTEESYLLKNNLLFKKSINSFNNNYNIDKKTKNKTKCYTKIFIKSLLDISLTSYEVNHIVKLIKTSWIFGIYCLLNTNLNYLFNQNQLKVEGFVFEFIYIKVSLIETDNTQENLNLFNISVKDLLTGKILNKKNIKDKDDENRINKINNNNNLINFLNKIIENEKYKKDEGFISTINKLLLILEKNISFFVECIWKSAEKCDEIENEYKQFCNEEKIINKFKKSKEIKKIIINKVKNEFSQEVENIEIKYSLKGKKPKDSYFLNKLEENNNIKKYIEEIIEKILELSKKEKFEKYFVKKKKKKRKKYIFDIIKIV